MYRIAICDDDIAYTEYLEKKIKEVLGKSERSSICKYYSGEEVEVDAICDGENFLIPGIMEHIERAGIHSGDSISVYPAQSLSQRIKRILIDYTGKLARVMQRLLYSGTMSPTFILAPFVTL